MRRMTNNRPNRRTAAIYVCALIALLVYGVPRIPSLKHGLAGTFSMLWILFAGLALAGNLYFLVGADRERSKMLEVIERSRDSSEKETSGEKRRLMSNR